MFKAKSPLGHILPIWCFKKESNFELKGNCKYSCEYSVNDHKGQTCISQQVHAKMYKDSFPYEMLLEMLE